MKKTLSLFTGIAVIVILTAAVTAYSGSLLGRWGKFKGMDEARVEMKSLPMEIGQWEAGAWQERNWVPGVERELDDLSITMLQIQNSYIFRTYKNTVTQEEVHLTLMVGPTGRITVHTPDICFGGRDYEKESTRNRVPITVQLESGKEIDDTFWRIDFVGRSLDMNNRISFFYAVSTGDAWSAAEQPRWNFRTFRYVYKLQVQAYSGSEEEGGIVQKFLEDCLPTIHEHLQQCR